MLYPAELRAERLSHSTGGEVYHALSELPVAHRTLVSGTLAPAFWGRNNMTTQQSYVSATLTADQNKAAIEAHLHEVLECSLTPMEPGQAKVYMEHTAVRMAEEAGAGVTTFQMVEIKHASTAYMIRLAVLSNGHAIGLDLMDLENGQFFIPEVCPVIPLETPTVN